MCCCHDKRLRVFRLLCDRFSQYFSLFCFFVPFRQNGSFFIFLRNIHSSIAILKTKLLEYSYPPSQYFFVNKAFIRFFSCRRKVALCHLAEWHTFSVDHALCCKKGGFISARHDKLRNLLAGSLTRVCNNVEVEPQLTKIDNEVFRLQTTSNEDDARLDIKASDFWETGQTTFFDVRVTHVNAPSHGTKATTEIFKSQENEKKSKYLERIVEVENSSFTPLVFGTNGGMGKERSIFLKQLAVKLSRNEDGNSYSTGEFP